VFLTRILTAALPARSKSRSAFRRVASEVLPFSRGGNFTPARRTFDRPLPSNVRHVIQHQYMSVQAAHDHVRDLRDRFQS
jgi:hypothetical protein